MSHSEGDDVVKRVPAGGSSPSSRCMDACCDCMCGDRMTRCCTCLTDVFKNYLTPTTSGDAWKCGACSIILLLVAIGLIVQAVVVPQVLHKALVTNLHDAVLLDDPTSEQFIKWTDNKEADAPLMLTTYVWDIQNPEEVIHGAKPNAVEMGPFVFKQYTKNHDLAFGENHSTLFFRSYTWYEFVPEKSVGPLDTPLTTLNMPFITMRSRYEPDGNTAAINFFFTTTGWYKDSTEATRLFIRRNVSQVLFGWDDDPVLTSFAGTDYNGLLKNYPSFNASLDDPRGKQYFNQIYTGANGTYDRIRNYLQWHNKSYIATCGDGLPTDFCDLGSQIPGWNNHTNGPPIPGTNGAPSHVSLLRGNDASVFPAPLTGESRPTTFFSPLLRSIDLEYKRATTYKNVPLLQYGFPSHFWENNNTYPPNAAYNQFGPKGLVNMTVMQGNIPLFVSQPRFVSADSAPSLRHALNATFLPQPKEISPTIFDVEPESGVTFHVRTSSQVNVFISQLNNMPNPTDPEGPPVAWFDGMKDVFLPIMWADLEGGIGDDDAKTITTVISLIEVSKIVGFAGGVLLAIGSMVYIFLSWRTHDMLKQQHKHQVRHLLASSDDGGSGAGAGSSSLLDPSVLIMREDGPGHRNYSSADAEHSANMADIDISYRRGPRAPQPSPPVPPLAPKQKLYNSNKDDHIDPPSSVRRGAGDDYSLYREADGEDVAAGETVSSPLTAERSYQQD